MGKKTAKFDALFLKAALKQKLISKDQAKAALRFQKSERESGQSISIGQILIKRRMLSCDDFLAIYNRLEHKIYECQVCKTRYRARELQNKTIHCRGCGQMIRVGSQRLSEQQILQARDPARLTISMASHDMGVPAWGAPKLSAPLGLPTAHPKDQPKSSKSSSRAERKDAPVDLLEDPLDKIDERKSRRLKKKRARTERFSRRTPAIPKAPLSIDEIDAVDQAKEPKPKPRKTTRQPKRRYRPALDFSEQSLKVLAEFEFVKELGRGGMGVVFKARHKDMDRMCAVKVITTENQVSRGQVDRFLQEGRSAAQLEHPNIVKVFDCGEREQFCFISMEYIKGHPLADDIKAGNLDLPTTLKYLDNILDAVEYAHQRGVVHRDLKPQNILVDETHKQAKLIDFGLAKDFSNGLDLTQPGQILGSPYYLSPEQTRGESYKVDGRSDVFALGVILYEMASGKRPFVGKSAAEVYAKILHHDPTPANQVNPDIDKKLLKIIERAMKKDPKSRYQSARAMQQDIQKYFAKAFGRPIDQSSGPGQEERPSSREQNRRRKSASLKGLDKKSIDKTERRRRNSSREQLSKAEANPLKRGSSNVRPAVSGRLSGRMRATSATSRRTSALTGRQRSMSGENRRPAKSSKSSGLYVLLILGLIFLALIAGLLLGQKQNTTTDPNNNNPQPPITTPDKPNQPNNTDKPKPDKPNQNNPDSNPSNNPRQKAAQEALDALRKRVSEEDPLDFGDIVDRLLVLQSDYANTPAVNDARILEIEVRQKADQAVSDFVAKMNIWAKARDFLNLKRGVLELSERLTKLAALSRLNKANKQLLEQVRKDAERAIQEAQILATGKKYQDAIDTLQITPTGFEDLDKLIELRVKAYRAKVKDKTPEKPEIDTVVNESAKLELVAVNQLINDRQYQTARSKLRQIPTLPLSAPLLAQKQFYEKELELLESFFEAIQLLGQKLHGVKLQIDGLPAKIIAADADKLTLGTKAGGRMTKPFVQLSGAILKQLFEKSPFSHEGDGYLALGAFMLREHLWRDAEQAFEFARRRDIEIPAPFLTQLTAELAKLPKEDPKPTKPTKEDPKRPRIDKKGKASESFVVIKAGVFPMGDAGVRGARPVREVQVSTYAIHKFEVTNRMYRKFLIDFSKAKNRQKYEHPSAGQNKDHTPTHWNDPAFAHYFQADLPVVFVDWYDAYAYAKFYGLRLPTEAEWEKAARGPNGRKFPWGNNWDMRRCVAAAFWAGRSADQQTLKDIIARRIAGKRPVTAKVNSLDDGRSYYGVYNMAGNVMEWCADWYDGYYYGQSKKQKEADPKGPTSGTMKVLRGGSYLDVDANALQTFMRYKLSPTTREAHIGFRCVKSS